MHLYQQGQSVVPLSNTDWRTSLSTGHSSYNFTRDRLSRILEQYWLVTLRMHGALPQFFANLRGAVIMDGNNIILPLPKATVINQPEDILYA